MRFVFPRLNRGICHRYGIFLVEGNNCSIRHLSVASGSGSSRHVVRQKRPPSAVSTRVIQVAKTSRDFTVVGFGVVVVGLVSAALYQTLLSGDSPYKAYNKSFDIVREDANAKWILGEPLKAFDESKHRRGGGLDSQEVEVDGVKCIRIGYDVQGTRSSGRVFAEMRNIDGRNDFSYIILQIPRQRPIVIRDRRAEIAEKAALASLEQNNNSGNIPESPSLSPLPKSLEK